MTIAEILERLEHIPCIYWACEGPDQPPEDMVTCHVCWLIYDLRQQLAKVAS